VEHIKRCYLIPVATGLTLTFLHSFIDISLYRGAFAPVPPVFIAVVILFHIGIADSIFAVINRRTVMSKAIGIPFLVFAYFAVIGLSDFREFVLMLSLIGVAGVASAFFNGRTATAVVSGISVLAFGFPFLVSALGGIISNSSFNSFEFSIMRTSSPTGIGILAVAFITHTRTTLSKLRIFYLISLIWLIPFQFSQAASNFAPLVSPIGALFSEPAFISEEVLFFIWVIWANILAGGGVLAVAFIAHSNMKLYKKALFSILPILLVPFLLQLSARWLLSDTVYSLFIVEGILNELLPLWIAAGCIMMGINKIIDSNDSSIDSHKDSLKL